MLTLANRTNPNTSKYTVAASLIEKGWITVWLQTHNTAVVLPRHLRHKDRIALCISFNSIPKIYDLVIDSNGFAGTLIFSGLPYWCDIPWSAVYAIIEGLPETLSSDSKGSLWFDDCPPKIRDRVRKSVVCPPTLRSRTGLPEGWGVIEGGK